MQGQQVSAQSQQVSAQTQQVPQTQQVVQSQPPQSQEYKDQKSTIVVALEFLKKQKDLVWREYANAWDDVKQFQYGGGFKETIQADLVFAREKYMIAYKTWLKFQVEGLKSGELIML
jgi:hypothetical protein